jgi:hypothetical protein
VKKLTKSEKELILRVQESDPEQIAYYCPEHGLFLSKIGNICPYSSCRTESPTFMVKYV